MEKKNNEIICRCEEVTRKEIEKAIEDGARTIKGIKIRTRAGMGLCQGKTCRRLIRKIIAEKTGQKPNRLLPPTFRPPVRVLNLKNLEKDIK